MTDCTPPFSTRPGLGDLGLTRLGHSLGSCDTLPRPAPVAEPGRLAAGTCIGAYVIEARIGVGGTCEVYCSRHLDGSRVAIRLPRRATLELSPSFGDRLVRTSLWLRGIRHPNLVRVLDHGVTSEISPRPFQVVELVDGEGLDALLERAGPAPWRWVAEVIAQLADALRELHRAGLVHCDVKPANVMLLRGRGAPRVKLLDCDLAWRIGAPKEPGVAPGTPRYLPPEQALGVRPTPHTDIYSLGVTALELLRGRCPIGDSGFLELIHEPVSWPQLCAISEFALPRVRVDAAEVPEAMLSLLRRMTSPQRSSRPGSMVACARVLRRILAGSPPPPLLDLTERVRIVAPRAATPLPPARQAPPPRPIARRVGCRQALAVWLSSLVLAFGVGAGTSEAAEAEAVATAMCDDSSEGEALPVIERRLGAPMVIPEAREAPVTIEAADASRPAIDIAAPPARPSVRPPSGPVEVKSRAPAELLVPQAVEPERSRPRVSLWVSPSEVASAVELDVARPTALPPAAKDGDGELRETSPAAVQRARLWSGSQTPGSCP